MTVRRLGILVAGGSGRRMGGAIPKALLSVNGRTLLSRAEGLIRQVCDDYVVCAPAAMVLPVEPLRRVSDPEDAAGPLAGLVAGLRSRPFEVALALGVDFPLLEGAMLQRLLEHLGSHAAVMPAPHGVPQPLAAWYTSAAVSPLAAALKSGERSLTRAALTLPHAIVSHDELARMPGGAETFLNVNTPEDLLLAEQLHERPAQ